ncbi:efflux RND transporter permease subunit [Sphingobium sp. Ant17]|uniref:efflux RND transporter permease subunit n=1 Tax=Sphingobium sp. Ant17 TaxID=1461752 RepID=UPI0004B2FAFB|nr:efflux RND transporter permease subunit [Sphingobium sp. Ant17]
MIERIIEWCAQRRWIVLAITLVLAAWAVDSVRKTPLDALPDLSDPQVIVFTDWMGRSPNLVEDQITYRWCEPCRARQEFAPFADIRCSE